MSNDLLITANQRATATPIVRSLANRLGVPLAALDGTGAGGRITPTDVRAAAAARQPTARRANVTAVSTRRDPLADGRELYAKRHPAATDQHRLVPALPSLSAVDIRQAG